jgi:hypothetical protein
MPIFLDFPEIEPIANEQPWYYRNASQSSEQVCLAHPYIPTTYFFVVGFLPLLLMVLF